MKIDFANLALQHQLYKEEIESAIHEVISKCNFIMGEEVELLERELEAFTGAKHAITCASGTDALLLALMALGIKAGDEVITTPFTFIATAEMIALLGAKPLFVDIEEESYNLDVTQLEKKITPKTKAILPVHLYGQPSDLKEIMEVAKAHDLRVVIDGAQSFGSTYEGVSDSALGDISCTSFFPAKPLGCYGDGGALFTSNEELAAKIKSLRIHGQTQRYHHQYIGIGGRLDTIQAAVLRVKLRHYSKDLAQRVEVAKRYSLALSSKEGIILPQIKPNRTSAFAQYSIRVKERPRVQARLKEAGVPTAVHYPMPLHLQGCFAYLRHQKGDFPVAEQVSEEILSLPMNPYVSEEEMEYIGGCF